MVTRLTKYPKTVYDSVLTPRKARKQKAVDRPRAATGTPRLSV